MSIPWTILLRIAVKCECIKDSCFCLLFFCFLFLVIYQSCVLRIALGQLRGLFSLYSFCFDFLFWVFHLRRVLMCVGVLPDWSICFVWPLAGERTNFNVVGFQCNPVIVPSAAISHVNNNNKDNTDFCGCAFLWSSASSWWWFACYDSSSGSSCSVGHKRITTVNGTRNCAAAAASQSICS